MRLHLPERWRPGDRPRRAAAFLARRSVELGWVIAIFFTCELLIWGIYAALRLAGVQFLSPIVGMVAVFLGMLALARVVKRTEDMYGDYLRSKVSFTPCGFPYLLGLAFSRYLLTRYPGRLHQQESGGWIPRSDGDVHQQGGHWKGRRDVRQLL